MPPAIAMMASPAPRAEAREHHGEHAPRDRVADGGGRQATAWRSAVPPSPRSWMMRASTGKRGDGDRGAEEQRGLEARDTRARTIPVRASATAWRRSRRGTARRCRTPRPRPRWARWLRKSIAAEAEPDQEHVEADAELRDDVQHRLRFRREQQRLELGREQRLTRTGRARTPAIISPMTGGWRSQRRTGPAAGAADRQDDGDLQEESVSREISLRASACRPISRRRGSRRRIASRNPRATAAR